MVERDEHVEGALPAQGGAPAAEDELLRLHEELDLADAAASELDVVTGDGDLVVPAHRVDLPLHGVHVGDRGEVEILAPDERREILEEALAEGEVAGDGPRLDQRGPLPVLANRLVVGVGGAERHRDRRRAGVGTQAVIDAMDVAVRRPLPQQLGEIARQAAVEGRGLVPVRQRRRAGIEEHDEIDIAGIVELAGAVLAEGEHDEAAARSRIVRIGERDFPRCGCLGEEQVDGARDAGVREGGQGARDLVHAPRAADIGERHRQGVQRARLAQVPPSLRLRDARPPKELANFGDQIAPDRLWRMAGAACEPGRLRQRELPQERRMIGDREQEITEGARLQMRQEGWSVRRVSGALDQVRETHFGALPIRDGGRLHDARGETVASPCRGGTFDANCHGLGAAPLGHGRLPLSVTVSRAKAQPSAPFCPSPLCGEGGPAVRPGRERGTPLPLFAPSPGSGSARVRPPPQRGEG